MKACRHIRNALGESIVFVFDGDGPNLPART
jgi:hypothetical protein